MPMPINAALMLPTADKACREPKSSASGFRGHDFGQQGNTDSELAADAKPRNKAIEREVPKRYRQCAKSGTQRVNQDGQHHRFGTADSIAEHAKDQSPVAQPARKTDVA